VAAEADLLRWVVMCALTAGFLLVRHWRGNAGAGLMFAYVLMFGVLHWIGPAIFLLPWHDQRGAQFTVEGLRLATIALIALTAGSEVVVWASRRTALAAALDATPLPIDMRLVNLYFVTGATLYLVVMPFAGALPSLTAFVSTGSVLMVLAMGLHCWNGWITGNRRRFWVWLAWSAAWPVVTVLGEGFLGYGFGFMLMVVAFVASFYRPRWQVVVAGALLAYGGLSVYVTYMRDRVAIRDVVWNDGALIDRAASVGESISRMEWFDFTDPKHLRRVEDRLNQDWLVGAASYYLDSRPSEFARGDTLVAAFAAVVPRAIWPDKPIIGGSGDLVSRYTGLRFADGTSVGVGQVMEAFVNFGADGVVLVFFVIGVVIVLVDRWSAYRLSHGDGNGFAVWYLPGLCLLQIGGSLSEVTSAAAASFVMAFLLNRIAILKRWVRGGAPVIPTGETAAGAPTEASL
jgi:hypothetical protein